MTDWECGRCRARVAPGAPRCPECPSTEFIKAEAEAGEVLKINRDGIVSDSAAVAAFPAEQEHPGYGVPMTGIEHPADGTMSPPIGNDAPEPEAAPEPEPAPAAPAAPPVRTPPRRSAPPAVPRE